MRTVTEQLKVTLTPGEMKRFRAIAKRIGDGSNVNTVRAMMASAEARIVRTRKQNPSPASVSQATTITRRGFRKSPAPGIGSKRKAK